MTEKGITLIRQARLDRGLSLRAVADATGIPKTILQRIETGARITKREHARAIYKYYDYQIDLADIYDPNYDDEVVGVIQVAE